MGRKVSTLKRTDDDFFYGDSSSKVKSIRSKQRYPDDSKAGQLHEGKQISLKTKITPKTYGQEFYMNTLAECTITLATGPAGCGKTWMATHYALSQLLSNKVQTLVVTKPILEAGEEEIGFLPGELEDKVAPHFQSVLDCIEDHIGPTYAKKLLDQGKIKFLPIAYCRGRDIKNSFILIDEAQNATKKGLKLLMTRLSEGSMMAINGDDDQCDLKDPRDSGLAWAVEKLAGKDPEIGIVQMTDADIQRHHLIKVVLKALRS